MRPRTLRGRLVLAAVAAIVVAIVLLGVAATVLVGRELRSSLDRSLHQRAADVARLGVSAPALLTAPGALDAPLGGRQLSVEVLDGRGRIVARSASLGARLLPAGPLLAQTIDRGRGGYANRALDGERIRLYAAPLAAAGGRASGGAVLVASSTAEIDRAVDGLRVGIGVSAAVAALLGALAAAWLTRRGLAPLRRLSRAAGQIERSGDGAARLPAAPAADEIGALADTLNRMLAGLERARDTERRFLADASHELRTPLTALRGNAAYVARHGADPEALADLEADAIRLGRLLDDLLALEREPAAAPLSTPVRLDAVVAAIARQEPLVEVGESEPVAVAGDSAALERVVANLVENARVHGPAGGSVTVTLRRDRGWAKLSVRDEGPGLTAAQAAEAFGRFWRGPDAIGRPGSGLGLAIVRATVERHGGRVTVEGSRFEVELPALKNLSEPEARVTGHS